MFKIPVIFVVGFFVVASCSSWAQNPNQNGGQGAQQSEQKQLLNVSPAQTPSMDAVISNYYNAIGGADKFKTATAVILKGRYISSDGSWKKKYTLTLKDSKLRTEMDIQPGMKSVQAFDGKVAWSIMPWSGSMEPQPMNAEDALSMSVQTNLIRNDLIMYVEQGTDLAWNGSEELDGSDCYKVVAKRKDGVTKEYFLDVDSYLLVKVVTKFRVNDEERSTESYFSNYRLVNGMMLPSATENKRGGGVYIDTFEINPSIDDTIFVMPKKG